MHSVTYPFAHDAPQATSACGISRACFAIRSSFVDTVMEPDVSAIFPSNVPVCSGAPFPPRGPSGRFPRFPGTMKHSDFPPPLARRFVSFASRYRRCALGFAPADARRSACGPGVCCPASPYRSLRRRRQDLPGSWRTPTVDVPCSSTPADLHARPLLRFGVAFRLLDGVGSHDRNNFEAQSHGPHTRCLRFVG